MISEIIEMQKVAWKYQCRSQPTQKFERLGEPSLYQR